MKNKRKGTQIHEYTYIYHKEFQSIGNETLATEVSVREKVVEVALVRAVQRRDGLALKFVSPGVDGVPDRIVLLPNGRIGFVELKAPGQKMRPLQEKRKRQLEGLGFLVFCVDSVEQIEEVLHEIQGA